MNPMKMLLVDEDEISREVLSLMLSDKCELTVLDNMKDAEKAITLDDYNIVLLDMQSTTGDSLHFCKMMSSQTLSAYPIVLGLGEDASEEKVRAVFEAGAYDYFIKPYNIVLFNETIQRLVNTIEGYQTLEENDQNSRDAVSIALSQTSYYGFAFDLLSEINRAKSIESLAQTVLQGLSKKGVHCALQINNGVDDLRTFEEDKDVIGERTLKVFDFVREQGRIFRFGKRLVFNDDNVSLLVKSMDDNSGVAYDCVLDICAKLIPCIENQIVAVSEHVLLEELQLDTKNILERLQTALSQQVDHADKTLQSIAGHINASIDKLELTEVQEKYFLDMIEAELNADQSDVDFEGLENAAKHIYDKIFTLQSKTEQPNMYNSQFGEIDLF